MDWLPFFIMKIKYVFMMSNFVYILKNKIHRKDYGKQI